MVPLNAFVSSNPVLNNQAVFWVFLILTLVTSIPRFAKVSKPAAQAIDQLEACAGIITILVIRFLPLIFESSPPEVVAVVQMGVVAVTLDILMGIAAVINIVVINTVKFFFEVMVWLMPIPFVDAVLEIANKSLCAGLMAIYAWSPVAATVLNLLIFAVCLMLFRWVKRQVSFFRTMVGDPIWALINQRYGIPQQPDLVVFPTAPFDPFPPKSRLILRCHEKELQLIQPRFLLPSRIVVLERATTQLVIREGLFMNSLQIVGPRGCELLFSHRYRAKHRELADLLGADLSDEEFQEDPKAIFVKA